MSALSIKAWSERQQVLAVIVMAGLVMTALWFFLLLPQNRGRKLLERRISQKEQQLASKDYLRGERALRRERDDEVTYNRHLHDEWTNTVAHMTAFPQHQHLLRDDVGHIDYKVALFDVRQRLLKKSQEMKIGLRHKDLGMDEAVRSDEDARTLMLQLRTVEKLVDFALNLQIDLLREIDPLPPIYHRLQPDQDPHIEEYPVSIEFYGNLQTLFELFEAASYPENSFVMRRSRIESEPARPDLLKVNVVMSALVFLRDPDELVDTIPKKPVKLSKPLGY